MDPIILASQSPRRKELLTLAEIPFEVIVSETDESFPPELEFAEAAVHIASNKADAVDRRNPGNRIILAADTVVICDNKLIGKPADRSDAIEILQTLSGKVHKVITGVCIITTDKERIVFSDATFVSFHELARSQIEFYIDKYKPYDKAGAYAIQEWIGAIGIKKIDGDFYNVMGLPISRVVPILHKLCNAEM